MLSNTNNNIPNYILYATGFFTLICGIILFIHPPALYPDPSYGFQVMRGMRMGGGFNMLPSLSINDLSQNNPSFLSWWSPGQYLMPYLFIILFGVNIGQAVALTVSLCSFIGLWGWYKLFQKLGFAPIICVVSVAFIACQQAYFIPYVFYNGGEILLFAFAGWFLYGCSHFKSANWLTAMFVFASAIAGFFCKSSFLWIFFSGSCYLWLRISLGQKLVKWLLNGLYLGSAAVLALVVIYLTYLSKGANPSSEALGFKFSLQALAFPLASPLLGSFSIDDLTNGLLYSNGPAMFSHTVAMVILIILAIISIIIAAIILKKVPSADYRLLLMLFYVIAVIFFSMNFLRQANISYESRHMRVIGLIITPGIIYLVSRFTRSYQIIFGLLWLFIFYSGVRFLYKGYHRNAYETAHSQTGIAQLFIDQPALNYISLLDQQQSNAIFVFISADLGLEITHNRIVTYNPVNDQLVADNPNTYYGHAGPIYIVLPASFKGPKAAVYMHCFPGYHNFTVKPISKNYLIYSAQ